MEKLKHTQNLQTQTQNAHSIMISIRISSLLQWCSQFNDNATTGGKTQVPIRLIVPASQCGSLIGKYNIPHFQ